MSSGNSATSTALPASLRQAQIYVAGHRGLVGSAILRALTRGGCQRLITRTHSELELTDQAAVEAFFAAEEPEIVLLCAAKVGGIAANNDFPAEFIHENLVIQSNVIHAAWRGGVHRLLFLGSSCIYPRDCPQPIREEYLLTGSLEATNRPYAIAKIAGVEMCWSYNRQYGTRYLALMPTNLYGPGDNYDLESSHVLPALIRKCHQARMSGASRVQAWGSGTPRRELLYSDDLAEAVTFLLTRDEAQLDGLFSDAEPPLINVGSGEDLSIAELMGVVKDVVGFKGEVVWERNRADGTPRKLLDVSAMHALGWRHKISLEEGIGLAYADFQANWRD